MPGVRAGLAAAGIRANFVLLPAPAVQASIAANTFVVSGPSQTRSERPPSCLAMRCALVPLQPLHGGLDTLEWAGGVACCIPAGGRLLAACMLVHTVEHHPP